jgi:hypothetical protein
MPSGLNDLSFPITGRQKTSNHTLERGNANRLFLANLAQFPLQERLKLKPFVKLKIPVAADASSYAAPHTLA